MNQEGFFLSTPNNGESCHQMMKWVNLMITCDCFRKEQTRPGMWAGWKKAAESSDNKIIPACLIFFFSRGCCRSSYDYNENLIPLWWDLNRRWAPRLNINTCFRRWSDLLASLRWCSAHILRGKLKKKEEKTSRSRELWLQLFTNSAIAESSTTITQCTRVLEADGREWPEDAKVTDDEDL